MTPTYDDRAPTAMWPSSRDDLTNPAVCPSCFAPLTAVVCTRCGLDLTHAASSELLAASLAAATSLDRRLEIIGRIRSDTAAAKHAPAVPVAPWANVQPAVPAAPVVPTGLPAHPATPVAPATPAAPTAPPAPPSHPATSDAQPRRSAASSVQLTLLIVGISALSVGAIFFLVYAFVNFGLVWRSVIIGSVTVAAFASATLLARRRLRATAEGISAFAIVLVYLDAFAIRANDFFGSAGADGNLFWGVTLVLAAAGFVFWNRVGGLRIPSLVGFSTFAPGVGLITAAATTQLDASPRAWLITTAIATAGIGHRLAWRPGAGHSGRAERVIVLATTLAAVPVAVFAALVMATGTGIETGSGIDAGIHTVLAVLAMTAVAAIIALHLAVLRTMPGTVVFAGLFSVLLGIALALLGLTAAIGVADEGPGTVLLILPVVAAAIVALAAEFTARRATDPFLKRSATVVAWTALVTTIAAAVAPVGLAFSGTIAVILRAVTEPWTLGPLDTVLASSDEQRMSVLALTVIGAITAAVWTASGAIGSRPRRLTLAWFGFGVAILAPSLLGLLLPTLLAWFLLAVGALTVLVFTRSSTTLLRVPLIALLFSATAMAWMLGWASEQTWAATSAAAIGLLLCARAALRSTAARASVLGLASGLLLVSAAAAAHQLGLVADTSFLATTADSLRFVGLTAMALLVVSALPWGRLLGPADLRTLFWIALAAAGATAVPLRFGPFAFREALLASAWTALVAAVFLVGALILWSASRATATYRPERIAASLALSPAVWLLVDAFAVTLEVPSYLSAVVPITAALIVSAGSLAVTALRSTVVPRVVRDIGIALVAVPALLRALGAADDTTWLVLLLSAILTLLASISRDGLFSSGSARRHLVWAAAGLGTAALWWRLAADQVRDVEPWVLPLSGMLLLMALLLWRANARRGADSRVAPLVALAGLLVAILPIAVAGFDGSPTRALIVAAVSAALLLAGSIVIGSTGIRPFLEIAALAGALGVAVAGIGRAAYLVQSGARGFEADAWLAATLILLIGAAFGLVRDRGAGMPRLLIAARAFVLVGLAGVIVVEAAAIALNRIAGGGILAGGEVRTDAIRAIVVLIVLGGIHVLAFILDRAPLTRLVAWTAIGGAALVAAVGIGSGALDPLEAGTVPVALALLASGAVHLESRPRARSWPWLGPAIGVLLVPSLLATIDDGALWRIVAIGVVGVATIVLGATLRLQAPFLIGSAVVLVHVLATFAPQIRAAYEYVPWWLWLVVGGALLVVLAARFERRLRDVRNVARRIGSLR